MNNVTIYKTIQYNLKGKSKHILIQLVVHCSWIMENDLFVY